MMKSLDVFDGNRVFGNGWFMFAINKSVHPYHAKITFSNDFPAPTICDVNTGQTRSLPLQHHLKIGEVIHLGRDISIMMTRYAKVKYRISLRAPEDVIIEAV